MSLSIANQIAATALTAQRLRMDVIAENIANANTTRTVEGGPYKRKVALFEEKGISRSFQEYFDSSINTIQKGKGVRVSRIVKDPTEGPKIFDPGHPDADAEGYVSMPNVNIVEEMVNMISASRSYEANLTTMNTTKTMMARLIEAGR